jgi:meso-butanediol dehydrogenase/(S,S)-butanediol dehydrogenase/diacetyl reductase
VEEEKLRLQDTVAIVTGGGSGIGRAISERFAKEGAQVVVADLIAARAEETVQRIAGAGGTALAVNADVSGAQSVQTMVDQAAETYGRIDVLVNNAGLAKGNDILEIDEKTWDLNLDVVLKSVFLCAKAVLPGMLERKRGVILNIGSVNGLYGIGEDAYSAAKAGMVNLTQNLAVRYGPSGVRVNCICPGTIRTPIWNERLQTDPNVFEKLTKWYPLRRVGEPEDIANAALFLASDEASWITGAVIPVDGGLTAGNPYLGADLEAE